MAVSINKGKDNLHNERRAHYHHDAGIDGQAVLEGIMIRNRDLLAVAVRKPDQEIEIEVDEHHSVLEGSIWTRIPVIRGIFALIDVLAVAYRSMRFSAVFYDDTRKARQHPEELFLNDSSGRKRREYLIAIFSVIMAILVASVLFIFLPFFLLHLMEGYIRSRVFLVWMEALIRIVIFLAFVITIFSMKDVRRICQYHGAEHKCINCIERGKPLTINYVRDSSRYHRGCDAGLVVLVFLASVMLFFFIHIDSRSLRLVVRLLLVPLVAGLSYEFIRWTAHSDTILARIFAAPQLWLQRMTTREPDEEMIRVGIASMEAVFDWRAFLSDEFGYDRQELGEP